MKIASLTDYADHIISAKDCIKKIEKHLLKNDFEAARMVSHELKLQAMHLEQSIQAQIK